MMREVMEEVVPGPAETDVDNVAAPVPRPPAVTKSALVSVMATVAV